MSNENTSVASEVVSGREVDGAIRIQTVGKPAKPVKLRKDGQPRKARKVTSDKEFFAAWKNAVENGGTIQSVADAIGAEYGSVIQRRESINELLVAAGRPMLPDLSRASGPRKNPNSLLSLFDEAFAPIGKGELESLPVDAPIQQGPPAMKEDAETLPLVEGQGSDA